jgi:hypothetical protein
MVDRAYGRLAEADDLEDAATELLKAAGAFRRGTGIRSPRSLREAEERANRWEDWLDVEVSELGSVDLWDELDTVAAAVRLKPLEKAVLGMARVQEYSLQEIATILGVTVHRVRTSLDRALLKCWVRGSEPPLSLHVLFWEEVRQKRASIYHAPSHSWRTNRTVG